MELTRKEIFYLLAEEKKILRESVRILAEIPELIEYLEVIWPTDYEFEKRLERFSNAKR